MINLRNVSKRFGRGALRKTILDDVTMSFPTGASVALLGRNGAGKSTCLKLLAGVLEPSAGRIERHGSVSWPVGFSGSFHPDLTAAQNTGLIARIYGVAPEALLEFVEDFSELGEYLHQPFRQFSSGMRARFAFGLSMGIHFDTYLVDEVTAVGDRRFHRKTADIFADRMRESGAIFVSHSRSTIRQFCNAAVVLENGKLNYFADIEDGLRHYDAIILQRQNHPMHSLRE